jgi:hypothetical protein
VKITELTRNQYFDLLHKEPSEFMQRIHTPEIFIVKEFYAKNAILSLRDRIFQTGMETEPSWHPLYDGCPDYHRLHDNYEKAYVKGKIHMFYHHGWYEKNHELFEFFKEIFEMKIFLAGKGSVELLRQIPSQGVIARVNFHHYPGGGGYQAEHIDQHGEYALIQTIVQTSTPGKDFHKGGLYARETPDSEPFFIDPYTSPGDLIVLSTAIRHGVAPIDEQAKFDWQKIEGRWIIMPMLVWSDYPHPESTKPIEVKRDSSIK